ncbi:MAG: AbrB/MazE/SpoVT family DNA-binding domain-containing protein [Propionibacteriaceae bacterium]|nr:AbrB/MazE/SpoVT family DNA-binding domain-containing protein [Propionibacteriaceae bacterium]
MGRIAAVTSRGQVLLPVDVRHALGIETGDRQSFTLADDRIVVRPAPDFLALAGSVAVPDDIRGLPWGDIRDRARQATRV